MTPRPVGIYIPDNPALAAVLDGLPGRLKPYADQARYIVSAVVCQLWLRKRKARKCPKGGPPRLSATIMRRYIPKDVYTDLRRFLESAGVLVKVGNHSAGHHAAEYMIGAAFDGPAVWFIVRNPRLAKKIADWRDSPVTDDGYDDPELQAVAAGRRAVLDHERACLRKLTLDGSIEAVAAAAIDEGTDPKHADLVCKMIAHGDAPAVKLDAFGRRAHHILTRTAKAIRRRLLLVGLPLAEVDVANAQPLLLGLLFQGIPSATYEGSRFRQHNGRGPAAHVPFPAPSGPVLPGSPPPVPDPAELADFIRTCAAGIFYDVLASDLDMPRKKVKKLVFSGVLFGKLNTPPNRVTRAFGLRWPTMLEAVRQWKGRDGYKVVAQALQRLESFFMLDRIAPVLVQAGVPFLTIHDAFAVATSEAEATRGIMLRVFGEFGVNPRIDPPRQEAGADRLDPGLPEEGAPKGRRRRPAPVSGRPSGRRSTRSG